MLTLKVTLQTAMILLAAARATEQLASLRTDVAARSKQGHQLTAGSLLAPAASAAAVAYGHFIGTDTILLVAAWMNTITGFFCWTLRRLASTDRIRATGDQP